MLRSYHDVDYYKPRRHFCNLHRHNFLADHVDLVDLGACGGGDDGGGGGDQGGGSQLMLAFGAIFALSDTYHWPSMVGLV